MVHNFYNSRKAKHCGLVPQSHTVDDISHEIPYVSGLIPLTPLVNSHFDVQCPVSAANIATRTLAGISASCANGCCTELRVDPYSTYCCIHTLVIERSYGKPRVWVNLS